MEETHIFVMTLVYLEAVEWSSLGRQQPTTKCINNSQALQLLFEWTKKLESSLPASYNMLIQMKPTVSRGKNQHRDFWK